MIRRRASHTLPSSASNYYQFRASAIRKGTKGSGVERCFFLRSLNHFDAPFTRLFLAGTIFKPPMLSFLASIPSDFFSRLAASHEYRASHASAWSALVEVVVHVSGGGPVGGADAFAVALSPGAKPEHVRTQRFDFIAHELGVGEAVAVGTPSSQTG